jgi:hypothetical protein
MSDRRDGEIQIRSGLAPKAEITQERSYRSDQLLRPFGSAVTMR